MKLGALLVLATLAGCGGSNSVGSCDQRQTSSMACLDYNGAADVVATYKSACTAPQVWSDAPCPHANSVGGCQTVSTSPQVTITTWFYGTTPYTTATIMQACMQSSSTYVAP